MSLVDFGPTAAVLTVGDEVVEGRVVNANAGWLATRLAERGFWPRLILAAPDDTNLIAELLNVAVRSADVVIVSGGLGFTHDDITRRAVASALGLRTHVDPVAAEQVRRSCDWADEDIARAVSTIPIGAVSLPSSCGGVPGFSIGGVHVLPGSPAEMRAMFADLNLSSDPSIATASLRCIATEDRLLAAFGEFESEFPNVRLGSYPEYADGHPSVTIVLASRSSLAIGIARSWLVARIGVEWRDV